MSLTSFLKLPDVRERFKAEFIKPSLGKPRQLLAPPISKNCSLVGGAFDYLLRFYIHRLNQKCITREWVAETAVMSDMAGSLIWMITQAKKIHSDYLRGGKFDDRLLKTAICLAQLDVIYRKPLYFEDENEDPYFKTIGKIAPKDVKDLRGLISVIPSELFANKKLCVLNPAFGRASELVGGADADLIIDDALIEIKTLGDFELERSYFDQLIGYYVLSRIGGITGASKNHPIKKLGIYYSRHGHLWLFKVSDIVKEKQFSKFIAWFKKRARQEF